MCIRPIHFFMWIKKQERCSQTKTTDKSCRHLFFSNSRVATVNIPNSCMEFRDWREILSQGTSKSSFFAFLDLTRTNSSKIFEQLAFHFNLISLNRTTCQRLLQKIHTSVSNLNLTRKALFPIVAKNQTGQHVKIIKISTASLVSHNSFLKKTIMHHASDTLVYSIKLLKLRLMRFRATPHYIITTN